MKPWATIADALTQHGRCAMVTVAGTQGSAPREAGARMIVMPDGGFRGTIGGGALEWLRAWLFAGGLLIGFGTRLGAGCTSGHGVCGLSRLSPRSLVATLVFMTAGFVTATLITRGLGGAL